MIMRTSRTYVTIEIGPVYILFCPCTRAHTHIHTHTHTHTYTHTHTHTHTTPHTYTHHTTHVLELNKYHGKYQKHGIEREIT